MVMESKLKPVTCLTSISKKQKRELAENNFVFCKQIKEMKKEDFDKIKTFSKSDVYKVMKEAKNLCNCK
jgi:hypothetical protein